MKDLRNLPEPVFHRLNEAGWQLERRHAGFDVDHKRSPDAEPKTLEQRIMTHRMEARALADGTPVIRGYAAVYDHAYDVAGGPSEYGWRETIVDGAIDRSVREQDDVFLFFNHEGFPLARTTAGTLLVQSDKIGYFSEGRLDPQDDYSMSVYRRVHRGELDAMSWAFQATRQEWNKDYTERLIIEAKAFDQSVVNFPANPATVSVVGRSADRSADERQEILAYLASQKLAG